MRRWLTSHQRLPRAPCEKAEGLNEQIVPACARDMYKLRWGLSTQFRQACVIARLWECCRAHAMPMLSDLHEHGWHIIHNKAPHQVVCRSGSLNVGEIMSVHGNRPAHSQNHDDDGGETDRMWRRGN